MISDNEATLLFQGLYQLSYSVCMRIIVILQMPSLHIACKLVLLCVEPALSCTMIQLPFSKVMNSVKASNHVIVMIDLQ